MKKFFKGFTLIECLIALAILGIGTLVMAQIYANVSRINLNNHTINTSLAYQMKLVEEQTASDRVEIYYNNTTNADSHSVSKSGDGAPPDRVTGGVTLQKNYIQLTKKINSTTLGTQTYSFPVDIYVLLSRKPDSSTPDDNDSVAMSASEDKDNNLRYRYLTGHSNS